MSGPESGDLYDSSSSTKDRTKRRIRPRKPTFAFARFSGFVGALCTAAGGSTPKGAIGADATDATDSAAGAGAAGAADGAAGAAAAGGAGVPAATATATARAEAGGTGAVSMGAGQLAGTGAVAAGAAGAGAGAGAGPGSVPGIELATRFVHWPSQYRYSYRPEGSGRQPGSSEVVLLVIWGSVWAPAPPYASRLRHRAGRT